MECILLEDMEATLELFASMLATQWMLYIDRSFNIRGIGTELILTNLDGTVAEQALHFNFKALNNGSRV